MGAPQDSFMDLIQLHERSWGMQSYAGCPSLTALISGPVVCMWEGERPLVTPSRRGSETHAEQGRFALTVHEHVDELHNILFEMLVAGKTTPKEKRRLARIFVNQKEVHIKGLRLLLAE